MFVQTAQKARRLEKLAEGIEIPPSYYEKAVNRYKSVSEWLCREGAETAPFEPKVYVQGSFRLGLVNRPLGDKEEYDLDLVCELQIPTKTNITQKQLKEMIGREIASYAEAHGIKEAPTERKRCWRIDYADEVKFHIDNLPCIPEDQLMIARLVEIGVDASLAATSIALTCKDHPYYEVLANGWPMSNPAGYGVWFEGRFRSIANLQKRVLVESGTYKSIDAVPTYALKTPLQRAIQIFKRHRDFMFAEHPELKPISIILTTLAAEAYEGQSDLYETVAEILEKMPSLIRSGKPRIPNPVNPGEDFADKWLANPALEKNFLGWHAQASHDVEALTSLEGDNELQKLEESRFGIPAAASSGAPSIVTPRRTAPVYVVDNGPKPWGQDAKNANGLCPLRAR